MKLEVYKIEYDVPPMRSINWTVVHACSAESAFNIFKWNNPSDRIRKVELLSDYKISNED